jgi:hypothetical protein
MLVERVDPQPVMSLHERELTKITGQKWVPNVRSDGITEFSCPADLKGSISRVSDVWEGEISAKGMSWSLDSSWKDLPPSSDRIGFGSADVGGDYHAFEEPGVFLPPRDRVHPQNSVSGTVAQLSSQSRGSGGDYYGVSLVRPQIHASFVGEDQDPREVWVYATDAGFGMPPMSEEQEGDVQSDGDPSGFAAYMARTVRTPPDPRKPTDRQARSGDDAALWAEARSKEMSTLHGAGTFEEVVSSRGAPVIPTKWIYVVKPDSGKYKARLVACGNRDPFEGETYAPTANKSVMWLLFAISVVLRLFCKVIDVSAAFVAHDITRECFVKIDGRVYRLKKFLYGLIDAPKGFNDGMTAYVRSGGYSQSIFDPCLFYKWIGVGNFVYVMVHVDDFAIMGTSTEIVDEFITFMQKRYEITVKPLESYLGMEIQELDDGSRVFRRPKRLSLLFEKWYPDGIDERIPRTPMARDYESRWS